MIAHTTHGARKNRKISFGKDEHRRDPDSRFGNFVRAFITKRQSAKVCTIIVDGARQGSRVAHRIHILFDIFVAEYAGTDSCGSKHPSHSFEVVPSSQPFRKS